MITSGPYGNFLLYIPAVYLLILLSSQQSTMAKPGDTGHYKYYSNGDSNKTFILVKLTDSALNAIENHLSSNSTALPSISFKSDSSSGVLSFPVSKSNSHSEGNENSAESGERRFSFNLSNVEAGGPQGSFECLRQPDSRTLESLGSIQYKMQIHASEDSYERTKERMAETQNESKKYCTKVIKGIGSTVGRRSKVKKISGFSQSIVNGSRDSGTRDSGGGGGSHLHHSSALSSHTHHKSSSPTVKGNSGVSKYNLYHGSTSSTTVASSSSSSGNGLTSITTSTSSSLSTTSSSMSSNSMANHLSSSSANSVGMPTSSSSTSQPSSTSGSNSSVNREAIKGTNSSLPNNCINANNSRNANGGSKVTLASNPELMKRSLRERVIHLLALRPYKKPELLARLNKEGIKEKDKKNLSQVFNTISKLKENAYNLAAHAWHEVQVDDWPFYTPEQREIVRKRNPLTVQQRSSTGKYGLSPLTCLQDSSPPTSSVSTSSSSNNNNSNNNNINNSSLTMTTKRSADTGSSNKRQRLNANNQSSSKRGLSPNVALNHKDNSTMNNSNTNSYNNKTDLPDIMSEWSMKPRSPEPNYYSNSASNVDDSINNNENSIVPMSKSWNNENGGSDENRSSHNNSDYYVNGRSTVNNLSEYDQYDNSLGNGHSSHDAHRLTNGYSNANSSEGNHTSNGHHYSNRYSNNHHHGNSNGASKNDYNGDLNSGSGNQNPGNGVNRKRLKNGFINNNNHNVNNNHNNNNHNSSSNNNNNNHHSHNGVANLLNSGSMVNGSTCSTPNSSPDSGTGSNDGNLSTISSKSLSSINGELPDYAIKYVEIINDDQHKRYKEDFNREYKEYRRLHQTIDVVAQKFSAYEVKLKSLPEGSEEWNRTLEEVFREYDTIKKDYKFMESKRRAAYLHEKLTHIKKLIQEYKSSKGHRSTHYSTISHHHHNQQSNHH